VFTVLNRKKTGDSIAEAKFTVYCSADDADFISEWGFKPSVIFREGIAAKRKAVGQPQIESSDLLIK
jgi:hypothetical protein